LKKIQEVGSEIERVIKDLPGTMSAIAERTASGRYINIDVDRRKAARYGLNIADVHMVVGQAIGGMDVTFTVEGLERYPVNLRYAAADRDSVHKLDGLLLMTPSGAEVSLGDVATIAVEDGPGMIRSENARRTGLVYVQIKDGFDLASYVELAKKRVADKVKLPAGYSLGWIGQYQYMLRAKERLMYVVPLTLAIILILLYMNFQNFAQCFMVIGAVPLALVGAIWYVWYLDFNLSVAVAVGLIALAGVAAEFGVVMLVYLDQAIKERLPTNVHELRQAIIEGAVMRVRPKAMTAAVIIAGLVPIIIGEGTGSEVMKRIGAPMLGGMITAPLVSMVLIPGLYLLWKRGELRRTGRITAGPSV
jgi:Cu(I)/Ag(I) efflux system membrane protein CusA/SilA